GRTYDTLQAATSTNFGFGWRLEFRDVNVRTSLPPSGLEEFGIYTPFRDGARVYITLPGGKRQGFTFRPLLQQFLSLQIFHPAFEPDPGVFSKLTVPDASLFNRGGAYYDFASLGGLPYNPASPDFGGTYTLTTKEGVAYQINAQTRLLDTVTDTNSN